MSFSFTDNTIDILRKEITTHHETYKMIIKKPLKPKHHHLLHYVRMIKVFGPPRYFSCLHYEGKHRPVKKISKSVASRVNVSKTLTIRQQLELNHRFINSNGFNRRVKYGKILAANITLLPNYNLLKGTLRSGGCSELPEPEP